MISQFLLRTIDVDHCLVYYWEINPELERTIVMLHGIGGDHRGLMELGSGIKDYKVIILDLPGYGLSERLPIKYLSRNYAGFLDLFRKQLGFSKFTLLGHSYGGTIAIKYAEYYPDDLNNLILVCPISRSHPTSAAKLGHTYVKLASHFSDNFSKFLLSNKLVVYLSDRAVMTRGGKSKRKQILNEDYVNYKRADTRALQEGSKELTKLKISKRILDYKGKSLILAADRDTIVNLEDVDLLKDVLQNSIAVIARGGHLLNQESPSYCAKIINYYLEHNASLLNQK